MGSEKNKCDEADAGWEDKRKKDSVETDGSYSFSPTSLSFTDACFMRTFTPGSLPAECWVLQVHRRMVEGSDSSFHPVTTLWT